MSTMNTMCKNNKQRFTTIQQNILCDERLSLKEIGLLVKLLSLPDYWKFSENGLLTLLKRDGQASVRSGLKKLEELGYLKREKSRGADGKIDGVNWYLTDTPFSFDYPSLENQRMEKPPMDNPSLENPSMDNPSVENPPQYNTNRYNTNKYNTNAINTNSNKKKYIKKMTPPTYEEVRSYIKEKNYTVDAKQFMDYYESADWHDAKGKPVKNWKQRLATWNANNRKEKNGQVRTGSTRQKGTFDESYILNDNADECAW